ncbi:MAG TPA: hypothetical protein VMU59_08155, partial [Caulobacteraceae bacterium]|nr:hypothetical protein [Caulobacteraceae bacterium]
ATANAAQALREGRPIAEAEAAPSAGHAEPVVEEVLGLISAVRPLTESNQASVAKAAPFSVN